MRTLMRFMLCLGVWLWSLGAGAQTVEYFHTDALGSVVAITNANGQVIERNEYEPYGVDLTGAKDGPAYTGHVSDAVTGLSYMQQRYYDPTIGRFLSVDPIAANPNTGASFNRYAYVLNDPYKFTDPDGRCEKVTGSHICGGGGFAGSNVIGAIGPPSLRSGDNAPRSSGNSGGGRQGAAAAATAAGAARPTAGTGAGGASGIRIGAWLRGLLGRAVITAPLVMPGDSRRTEPSKVVIGEGMVNRVIPYAEGIGAAFYNPPPAPESMWMDNNRIWINQQMDQNKRIIDIGPEPGRANYPGPTSPYYQMELSEIYQRSYPNYERVPMP